MEMKDLQSGISRKIVVFRLDVAEPKIQEDVLRQVRAQTIKFLPLINGVVVYLSEASAEKLRNHPSVLRVSEDALVRPL